MHPTPLFKKTILSTIAPAMAVTTSSAGSGEGSRSVLWNTPQFVPPRAVGICEGLVRVLIPVLGIPATQLQVSPQTVEVPGEPGKLFGGAAVLLQESDPALVAAALDVAMAFVQSLTNERANAAEDDHTHPLLTQEALAASKVHGIRLPQALELTVPERGSVKIAERVPRLDRSEEITKKRILSGHLRSVVVGRKGARLTIRGVDATSRERFGDQPITFPEGLRKKVSEALASPERRIRLTIEETWLDDGSAKPKVSRTLEDFTIESNSDQADAEHASDACSSTI